MVPDAFFRALLKKAYEYARLSSDRSTQNGAIIVWDYNPEPKTFCKGWNTFPRGIRMRDERYERPLKYDFTEHAERNAIYDAARQGRATANALMVCPWAACTDCARAIIQSGITVLVRHQQALDRSPDNWRENIVIADTMFEEAKVEVVDVDAKNLFKPSEYNTFRHSGTLWTP